MQTDRFTSMSSSILGRIDELGTRIDELEKQIENMMHPERPRRQQSKQAAPAMITLTKGNGKPPGRVSMDAIRGTEH